jgi:hypothetical protein
MKTRLGNFLKENEESKELFDKLRIEKDKESFDTLLNQFNDYLFKTYAVGYIKSSIQSKRPITLCKK